MVNEQLVMALFRAHGLAEPVCEFCFAPPRKFRFDFCWPEHKLALEQDGGVWTGGRHTRPKGYLRDMEKLNLAVLLGWRVLRCTPEQMNSGEAAALVKRAMGG